jgi:hypothetical protein
MDHHVTITHWFPVITFCPINGLPDFIFVECVFINKPFMELYNVRKIIRRTLQGKKLFMEECAELVHQNLKCDETTIRLIFNKHTVSIKNDLN